jgi:nucleoid-associated protein YgaU
MAAITLKLGSVVFGATEGPAGGIPFGGAQKLVIQKRVGGTRTINAMGDDPDPIQWSGIFTGALALEKAKTLSRMRKEGRSLTLTWSSMSYLVVISSFKGNFNAPFEIPYQISLEVQADLTNLPVTNSAFDVSQAINGDMGTALGLSDSIGDGTLSSLMGSLNSAISTVSNFAKAAQSTINSVLQPLNAVRSQVGILISATENTLKNVATVGGVFPFNPIAQNIAKLSGQVNATVAGSQLAQLNSVLGRMGTNLGQVNSSVKTVTVSGGNLYDLAAKNYGDATGWTTIANANGITDPELVGVSTLSIPKNTNDTNGILEA